jgi:DNA-binding XRE family transcriptional regulator
MRILCDFFANTAKSSRYDGFLAKTAQMIDNPHHHEDYSMKISIDNANAIGKLVRASRKAQKIRQDDAAGSIGVSENFLGKIERGSENVQWGKLFQVLDGLGIRVMVDLPESVAAYLSAKESRQLKP